MQRLDSLCHCILGEDEYIPFCCNETRQFSNACQARCAGFLPRFECFHQICAEQDSFSSTTNTITNASTTIVTTDESTKPPDENQNVMNIVGLNDEIEFKQEIISNGGQESKSLSEFNVFIIGMVILALMVLTMIVVCIWWKLCDAEDEEEEINLDDEEQVLQK